MEDFRSGIGPTLQQELEKRARACSAVSWDSREAVNWLVRPRSLLAASLCCTVGMWFTHSNDVVQEMWWDDVAYLSGRGPLPVNVNVASTCFSAKGHPCQLERAAIVVRTRQFIQVLYPLCP